MLQAVLHLDMLPYLHFIISYLDSKDSILFSFPLVTA